MSSYIYLRTGKGLIKTHAYLNKKKFQKYTCRGVFSTFSTTVVLAEDYYFFSSQEKWELICICSELAKCLHKLFRINDGSRNTNPKRHFLACFLWHKNECGTGYRVYWPNSGIGSQLLVEWTQKPKFTPSPSFGGKYLFHESLSPSD